MSLVTLLIFFCKYNPLHLCIHILQFLIKIEKIVLLFFCIYIGGINLVCEFCNEKQLSPEALERHTLAVHGALGIQNPEGHALPGHALPGNQLPSKLAKIEGSGGKYVASKLSKKGYRLSQGGSAQVAQVSHAPVDEGGHAQTAQVRHAQTAQVGHAQSSSGNYDFLHIP